MHMSEKYKVVDSTRPTFVTLTIIDWVDLFTRKRYCKVLDDALNYCILEKGLIVHAYVYMSSHIHIIVTTKENNLSLIVQNFKRHTTKMFLKEIKSSGESRKAWLLNKFGYAADRIKRNSNYKIWKDGFHPIILDTNEKIIQKVNYIHYNPVDAEICFNEIDYVNTSFMAYTDEPSYELNIYVVPLF